MPAIEIISTVVASGPSLVALYWVCAIIGLGLLLVSFFGGLLHAGVDFHADAGGLPDVHADVPADVHIDADVHADAGSHAGDADMLHGVGVHHHAADAHAGSSTLATWFSIRFCIFFIAVFGAVGIVLTEMTETTSSATLAASVLSGLVVGQGVHQLFRRICRTSGDSTPSVEDYLNQIGRVTVAASQGRMGEVAVSVRGCQRYIPATGKRADAGFQIGEEVAVVEYNGGVAVIVPRKEFEFLQDGKGA